MLAAAASVLAAVGSLEMLVQSASLAFLLLFCFVNGLAAFEAKRVNWLALTGAIVAAVASVVVGGTLALSHPILLAAFLGVCLLFAAIYLAARFWPSHTWVPAWWKRARQHH
jgi:hypothetical protein